MLSEGAHEASDSRPKYLVVVRDHRSTRIVDNCGYPRIDGTIGPMTRMSRRTPAPPVPESGYPQWFSAFLADRGVRKPSPHTAKAYRQDFAAIAELLAGDRARIAELTPTTVTKEAMRAAFAAYADTHEPASIRRCWSTWNMLCAFLYTSELLQSNPMPLIGRPKVAKSLPKGVGAETVSGLLAAIAADTGSRRRSDWPERDRALVLTAVLAGIAGRRAHSR
jgi:site-specific recombinase XerC